MKNKILLTLKNERKALIFLSVFHIFVIASSNYLVQFSVNIAEIDTTLGAFTFPFIFLATDLTIRIFGATLAREIIAWTMLPALLISYVISIVFQDAQYVGFAGLSIFNVFVFRIALASFMAYIFGQLLDIFVFNQLRKKKAWWIAPSCAAIIGAALDTFIFFFIAFYASADEFLATHWINLAVADYVTKLVIYAIFFLPAYGLILNRIQNMLQSN